jgi:hypothetical protein
MGKTSRLRWYRLAVLIALSLMVGCNAGKATGPVAHWQGKVTINGEPIPSDARGRIMFVPSSTGSNRNAKPAIVEIVNSRYDAPDVPIGPLTVTFDIMRLTGREIPREGGPPIQESESLVPEEHRNGVPVNVTEGAETHDFDL